jgi:hypothetical protein
MDGKCVESPDACAIADDFINWVKNKNDDYEPSDYKTGCESLKTCVYVNAKCINKINSQCDLLVEQNCSKESRGVCEWKNNNCVESAEACAFINGIISSSKNDANDNTTFSEYKLLCEGVTTCKYINAECVSTKIPIYEIEYVEYDGTTTVDGAAVASVVVVIIVAVIMIATAVVNIIVLIYFLKKRPTTSSNTGSNSSV